YDAANPGTSIPVISGALAGAGWATASDNFCTTNPNDLANPINYLNAEFAATPPAYNGAHVFAGSFDDVGINPFSIAPTPTAACPSKTWSGQYDPVARMKTLYDIEGANGSARPYWVTEFGASHNSITGDAYSTIFNQYFNAFDGLRAAGVPIAVTMVYDIRTSNLQPYGTLGSDWTAWPMVSSPDPSAVIRAQAAQPYTPNDALWNYDKTTSAFDATTLDLRDKPTATLAGDYDCDGYSDLLRYNAGGTNDDKLMWGNPSNVDGRWSPATFGTSFTYRNMNATATPVVGDFDGDGCDDILWYTPGTNKTVIWWGGTRANFGVTARATRTVAAGYVPVAGDFDGDGRTDVVWYRPGSKTTLIWWGAARASFGLTAPTTVSTSAGFTPVAGDYDGDHHADIAWYNRNTGAISLWWGTTRAAFGTKITKKTTAAGYAPFSGDFNGDGISDLFWYSPTASDSVWWGTTRTAFATATHMTPEVVSATYDTATVGSFSSPYVHSKTKRTAVPGLGGEPETILCSRAG
ncbi:MAG TPA: VCBS repeat-containing protein, partial [Acidimicrobiia bacterium]